MASRPALRHRTGLFSLLAAALILLLPLSAAAQWPQSIGTNGADEVVVVRTSTTGDVYMAGHYAGAIETPAGTLVSQGLQDVFIARLSPGGQVRWIKGLGGSSIDTVRDLTLDGANNVYVVGEFFGTARFGGTQRTSSGLDDGYIAKLDTNGNWQWAQQMGGAGRDRATSVVPLPGDITQIPPIEESVLFAGSYRCNSKFAGTPVLANGDAGGCIEGERDLFVVRVKSDGTLIWAKDRGAGSTGNEVIERLAIDGSQRVYAVGRASERPPLNLRNDNFDSLNGWSSSNGTFGLIFPTAGTVSGTCGTGCSYSASYSFFTATNALTLRAGAVSLTSPGMNSSGVTELQIQMEQFRGFDPSGFFFLPDAALEGQYSENPDSGEDLVVEWYGNDGQWRALDAVPGSGTPGERIYRTGSMAYRLSDVRAFHAGFQLRVRLTSGSGSFTNGYGGGQRYYDWWYVDNLRVDAVTPEVPVAFVVLDAKTDNPNFSSGTNLPGALAITDVALSPGGADLLLHGTRSGTGSNYCAMPAGTGAFVVALDVSGLDIGTCRWAKGIDGAEGGAIAVDSAGKVFFTGGFTGMATFFAGDGGTLTSTQTASGASSRDIYIASLTATGQWRWATGGGYVDPVDAIPAYAGGSQNDRGRAISVGSSGTVYVGGSFEGTARFGVIDSLASIGGADAFAVNLGSDGRFFQEESWTVGVALTPPPNAETSLAAYLPDFRVDGVLVDAISNKTFVWSPPIGANPARLIPLQPFGRIEVYWRVKGELIESSARTAPSIGQIRWPTTPCDDDVDLNCFQVHVVGAPVQAEPAAGNYKVQELVSPTSGGSAATYGNGVFNAPHGGTAVLVYVNGPELDQTRYPLVVEVVRSLNHDSVPLFVDAVPAQIGTAIRDPYHDEPGRTGHVVNVLAYYDGFGSDASYQRSNRTGTIIPVNRYSPARPREQGNELAVAWYHGKAKGVYWPEKAVRYAPFWPYDPEVIIIASEKGGEVLGQQPLTPAGYPSARIYIQNNPLQPGFNPNDEHALMAPSSTGTGLPSVFALRSDFGAALAGDAAASSDPYTLIKYFNSAGNGWRFRVYKVVATGSGFDQFRYSGTAATTVSPPYPVRLLPGCSETYVDGQAAGEQPPPPFFQDYKNQLWAKSEGSGSVHYYYPGQPGFFTDVNNDDINDLVGTACVAWLARLPVNQGGSGSQLDPIQVSYDIAWPEETPQLVSGETLLFPKRGLPNIHNQAAVEVVYDAIQEETVDPAPSDTLAQLIDPLNPRSVRLAAIPEAIASDTGTDGQVSILGSSDGVLKLPTSIGDRLSFNPQNKRLKLVGIVDTSAAGPDPFLLLNVLSKVDRIVLKKLDGGDGHTADDFTGKCSSLAEGCGWDQAVEALFRQTRNPQGISKICTSSRILPENRVRVCDASRTVNADDVLIGYQDENNDGILEPFQAVGVAPALTAGLSQGSGYMTVAFNNDPALNPLPVSLEIIRVGCLVSPPPPATPTLIAPYQGNLNVILPANTFDEQLVLRHSGDFGGNTDALEFQWFYQPDLSGVPPSVLPNPETGQLNGWIQMPIASPQGAVEISIEGANIQTLSDNWYIARYRGLPTCGNQTKWSLFAGDVGSSPTSVRAKLAEGWVKRVLARLNPFKARVDDFHAGPTNTYASMLVQLGARYEGPIALTNDPEYLQSIGLIEAYTTVMRRAMQLSIDSTPPVNYGPANNAILQVASKLVDFYTLLGNEAYADAQDPTIGITTDSGSFALNPSIFNFQNQLDSTLAEELTLLRGRDDSGGPTKASPVYNRLYWNFTRGDGEVAYALSYNITDQNTDGFLDEFDARILFPQGHGDAWGHYLTGTKIYYELLRHPFFTWVPRTEAVNVAGTAINVDFLDERQFAETAAAKARTGAEIVNLTYRTSYVRDPEGQYQGYEDTSAARAWGMSEWGRRAGMGAYFDWLMVASVVPAVDPDPAHAGIQKIERRTVESIDEIATQYQGVQAQVDQADAGLNPLGLADGVVAFDIDPSLLNVEQVPGRVAKTQFEQVYDRALAALKNAHTVWNFANDLNNQLRRNQDNADNLYDTSLEQELDFSNQLIEIFGYPYADDIGPAGTYPAGYDGPDLYHYQLIDVPTLAGTAFDFQGGLGLGINRIKSFTGVYKPMPNGVNFFSLKPINQGDTTCLAQPQDSGCPLGELDATAKLEVEYTSIESPDFGFWFTKPTQWTGSRRAPGRLQQTLQEMLQARVALKQSLVEYEQLRQEILAQTETLQATFDTAEANINIAVAQRRELQDLTIATEVMKNAAIVARRIGEFTDHTFENAAKCIPKSFIAGLAAGGDVLSGVACTVEIAGSTAKLVLDTVADGLDIVSNSTDAAKEDVTELSGIQTSINDANLDLFNVKGEIDKMIRQEPVLRSEIYARTEAIKQLVGNYQAALAEGQRALARLELARIGGAAATQQYRYRDMAFRIFRNDALQKYRAAFDLAARYVYLAATAYDYETNLLGSDSRGGQRFLTDVVKHRSLGQIINGEPLPGSPGLGDTMAQMKLNFDVLKGQMGFNNPQVETNRFSLRRELFRIPVGPEGDEAWRAKLDEMKVANLWSVPEFRRYARPFAPESAGPQPGLVIEFSTNVTFGMNYFGWALGPNDSSYDSSQFATRIRSVGAWFGDYASLPLADDPRIYLFPVGEDVLRAPSANDFRTREWQIVDQAIPVPFPIGANDLDDADWLPIKDTLNGGATDIRRYARFPAFHFTEPFNDSQVISDSRLVGRSVWNRRWLIIIPGGTFLNDPNEGLETFIHGPAIPGSPGVREENGISDIRIFFKTYAYTGQ